VLTDVEALVYSTILAWGMIMTASSLRSRLWTVPGMMISFSNRENVPEGTPLAIRAERAARNMNENLPLFIALVAAAHFSGRTGHALTLGANVFFWARLVYWPCLLAGIIYVRTLVWSVSVAGLGIIAVSLL
jgi:uncharacterized MAPEG superfamily protein